MAITRRGMGQVVTKRIDEQAAGQQESSRHSIAEAKPQARKSRQGGNQKRQMARRSKSPAAGQGLLRIADPEIKRSLGAKGKKLAGMGADKIEGGALFRFHVRQLAHLSEFPHGVGIVAGMLGAGPASRGLGIIGHVQLQAKIVADKNK